ncbi:hypothetical protein D3C72_914570 [compost metagenome]
MKNIFALTAALAVVTAGSPALAQVVIGGSGGNSSANAAQQPTGYLSTETASVLRDGLAYISAGSPVGNILAGSTVNYRRGMGRGGELAVGVGLNLGLNPGGFGGGVGAGWKQSLMSGGAMSMALDGGLSLTNLGTTNTLGATVGLPLSFGPNLTVNPRVSLPALTAGTAGGNLAVGLGYQMPLMPMWQLLAEVTPTVGFGGGVTVPVGVGGRFSPTATSHIDVTVGNVGLNPFGGNIGLVGLTGHIGF